MARASYAAPAQPQMENEVIPPELNGREDLRQFNPTRPYLIQFPTVCRGKAETLDLVQEIRRLRNRIVYHFGFTLPAFDIEFSDRLEADEFRFSVYEIPKVMGTFNTGCVAVEARWLESLSAQEQQALSASAESTAVAAPAAGGEAAQAEAAPLKPALGGRCVRKRTISGCPPTIRCWKMKRWRAGPPPSCC